jgi:hypothetical protein
MATVHHAAIALIVLKVIVARVLPMHHALIVLKVIVARVLMHRALTALKASVVHALHRMPLAVIVQVGKIVQPAALKASIVRVRRMPHAVIVRIVVASVVLMTAHVVMTLRLRHAVTVHSAALKSVSAVIVASVLKTNPRLWMNVGAEC